MELTGVDTILNALLALGVPGIFLAAALYLANKHVPKMIEAYKSAKQAEQKAYAEAQREHKQQIEKIIEVATASSLAVQQSTKAFEQNSDVNRSIIATLNAIEKSLNNFDRRTEEMTIDVKKILENARKAGHQ